MGAHYGLGCGQSKHDKACQSLAVSVPGPFWERGYRPACSGRIWLAAAQAGGPVSAVLRSELLAIGNSDKERI